MADSESQTSETIGARAEHCCRQQPHIDVHRAHQSVYSRAQISSSRPHWQVASERGEREAALIPRTGTTPFAINPASPQPPTTATPTGSRSLSATSRCLSISTSLWTGKELLCTRKVVIAYAYVSILFARGRVHRKSSGRSCGARLRAGRAPFSVRC